MKISKLYVFITFFLFLCLIASLYAERIERAEAISIIELIANQEDYDGKLVRVAGYVELGYGSHAVYLSSDDAKYDIFKNGLWLVFSKRQLQHRYDGRICSIEGYFNAANKGPNSLWSGAIENIERIWVKSDKD